ncbi:MAG TPA: metalloregulator ArsR/SmtB family transcription factor [Sedimentisphaerales bacterium]|nr:metalloregulator ArsR/SmtB family transcription factor [Sedimentisphaerales bacterium]
MNSEEQMLFEKQAEIIKAIGHPLRIAVINFLQTGPQCVCDIAEYVNSERSNVSKHLSIMVKVGILSYTKQGLKVIYTLKRPCICKFLGCITDCLVQQHKEDGKILNAL